MNIGYAMKIGFRSIRAGAASLDRVARAGGKVRLGKNGPTVVQAAAAGIIISKKNNMALSMIRTGCNIRKAARNTERVYNLVQFSKKFR